MHRLTAPSAAGRRDINFVSKSISDRTYTDGRPAGEREYRIVP